MKSKLLLSLGLVTILGMAQASEGTPEVRNIMEMFARLSPADQALVRTGILSQEHAPAVREESYTLPEWMAEKFGTGNRPEDVRSISVSNGKIKIDFSAGRFSCIDIDSTTGRLYDLLKTIAGGVFKNMEGLHLDFGTPVAEEIQTLIDCISGGKFLNMRSLSINTESLNMYEKMRLEQALLNSHSSSLEELHVWGTSFEFAKKMCDRKKSNFPQLNQIRLEILLDENFTELRRSIMRETGVLIWGKAYAVPETEDEIAQTELEHKLYREWERMRGQQD